LQKPEIFTVLFKKYLDNKCSPEEIEQLMDMLQDNAHRFYAEQLIQEQVSTPKELNEVDLNVRSNLEIKLQNIFEKNKKDSMGKRFFIDRRNWWAAASVACLIITAGSIWLGRKYVPQQQTIAKSEVRTKIDVQKEAQQKKIYTRNIVLPDGSTVILKDGSTLDYPASFNGSKREVKLTGEAYFDIKHDEQHQFVVHTGNVKTTVLGTAFNIKAYPEQKDVVVSVTRGRVKVENQKKVLAFLTKSEQVIYKKNDQIYKQGKIDAEVSIIEWTKKDVEFENKTFMDIADMLQKRFGVSIAFADPKLQQCTITASFTGTETLEKILSVLCQVRPAKFVIEEDRVMITGDERK
jgi:transmembrane sensor